MNADPPVAAPDATAGGDQIPPHPDLVAPIAALVAGGLIVLGFFLPWVEGASILDFRSFSGLDLARLVRNFEINSSSASGLSQIRLTALCLYLVPALTVNAVVLEYVCLASPSISPVARVAALCAGTYAVVILALVMFLSQVPVNDLERVVGTPSVGFVATATGASILVWLGVFAPRSRLVV